jgi:hypothetical protein
MSKNPELDAVVGPLAFILAPLRIFISILKWSSLVAAAIALFAWNQVMWVYGFGPRGIHARQEINRNIEAHTLGQENTDRWSIYEIDFAHRDPPFDYDQVHADIERANPYQLGLSIQGAGYSPNAGITGKRVAGNYDYTVPYCSAADNSADDLNTEMPAWFDRTPEALLRRKSARMRRAFIEGAIMVSALRRAITSTAFGIPIQDLSPQRRGIMNSFCNADIGDIRQVGRNGYILSSSFSNQVRIPDAPIIMMRVVDVRTSENGDDGVDITGMCIENDCDAQDQSYYLTSTDDIFAEEPPLSPGQLRAEKALLATGTREFWLRAAAANHITDQAAILHARRYAESAVEYVEHKYGK